MQWQAPWVGRVSPIFIAGRKLSARAADLFLSPSFNKLTPLDQGVTPLSRAWAQPFQISFTKGIVRVSPLKGEGPWNA